MLNNNYKVNDDFKVTVIGLGLIGGSLIKALYERAGIKNIIAVNRSEAPLSLALKDGFVNSSYTEINEQIYNSDIIFICTPVKPTLEYIKALSGKVKPECIVTDVCSTKTEILDFVNGLDNPPLFIGGHPMTGTEKTGYSESFPHLFENAYYILSKSKTTTSESLDLLTNILKTIGAIPVEMDSVEHDKITAVISHVPHIIAASLVNLVNEQDSDKGTMQMLAAGGFKDITRIASSGSELWESITMSNKTQIVKVLSKYVKSLEQFSNYVENNDSEKILNFFKSAKILRDSFSSNTKSLISSSPELIVDVMDKPGIIGEIATLLGENSISINNINVSNSREFEQGCLKVTLADSADVASAFDLLSNKGYKAYMNS